MVETAGVEEELVLTLDLKPGAHADAVVAAETLIAWVQAIRETNNLIDPGSRVAVNIISAEEGSLRFRAAMRFFENHVLGPPADYLTEFPRLKKIVVATVIGIPAGLTLGLVGSAVLPDATVNISPQERHAVEQMQDKARNDPAVQKRVRTFYSTVERDSAVTAVSVAAGVDEPPILRVPSFEFAERSGVWEPQEQAEHERHRKDEWQVIVTHAALRSTPHTWRFERDGMPFSAKMADEIFLAAIRDGTLPLTIQEGVEMLVEIQWTEHLRGQIWEADKKSRKITRVLSPRPRRSSGTRALSLD